MKNLNFIVNWGPEKGKAWSGTNLSIHNALSRYFNVVDQQIVSLTTLAKVANQLFPSINSMNGYVIRKNRRHFNNIQGFVFQFEEILKDSANRRTFIYPDLCVDYLCHLFRDDLKTFNISGFQKYNYDDLVRRNDSQIDYYSTCSGIFFMGKWQCEYLKNRYPHLTDKIIHSGAGANIDVEGIDLKRFKTGTKILFIGRDYIRKGGLDVINAFKILKQRKPDLELHFAGPHKSPLTEDIPGFYFHGDAPRKKVQELMNECDLFCMPSYFEAYGLVFVEALSHGLPCIGRNRCEMPYFIENGITGELVESDAIEELVCKIDRILDDKSYHRNVLARHDFYINEYSWDTTAARMASVIMPTE